MNSDYIATGIYNELNGADPNVTLSTISISTWVQSNVSTLNAFIFRDFDTPPDGVTDITETVNNTTYQFTNEEASLMGGLYYVNKYLNDRILYSLGAASYSPTLEYTSDGTTIVKTNRNELSKTYRNVQNDAYAQLTAQIENYKRKRGTPKHIPGDDTFVSIITTSKLFSRAQFNGSP